MSRDRLMRQRSAGVALIMALIFLIILTGISVFIAKRANLQLRMTSNSIGKAQTFEQAEAARIAAEAAAMSLSDGISKGTKFNCDTTGYYAATGVTGTTGTCKALVVDNLVWSSADSVSARGGRYAIEYLGKLNIVFDEDRLTLPIKQTPVHVFHIVAQGTEADTGARSLLETVYLRRSSN